MERKFAINEILSFAAAAHGVDFRKSTDYPYILHPMEVATIVSGIYSTLGKTFDYAQNVVYAALLHDTVEDAGVTPWQLEHLFGQNVRDLVAAESENKREDQPASSTWKERKQETIDHLSRTDTPLEVKIIAFADKLANLRSIAHDYTAMGEALWDRFNQKDPKEIRWYYEGVFQACDCAELKKCFEYDEYQLLLKKVFGIEAAQK